MAAPHPIALIGYGLAGRVFHAPLIEASPGLQLRYVVTSSPDRAAAVAQRHPGSTVLRTTEELWRRSGELAAVVVAAPNDAHIPLAMAALQHGLGVVVDKPLAASSAEAVRPVALAREKGLLCTVYQNRRWDGDYRTLARLVTDGSLGHVHRFESRFERWRPHLDASRWRESPDPARAGGLLYDLGSHLIDQSLHLFGPVRSVYAEVAARRPGARVDDDTFLALEHAGGTTSHLWVSMLAADRGPRLRALGNRAAYVTWGMDPQEQQLLAGWDPRHDGYGRYDPSAYGRLEHGSTSEPVPTRDGRWDTFYQELARALSGERPPPVDPEEAIACLRIIEAARASAQTRSVIPLA